MKQTLSIVMAVYGQSDMTWATLSALRMHNRGQFQQLVVIDNDPTSIHSQIHKKACHANNALYIPYGQKRGAAVRDIAIRSATGDWVMCIDPHVFIEQKGLCALNEYINQNPLSDDMICGPLVDQMGNVTATHMQPVWDNYMYGRWDLSDQIDNQKIFQIPMHSCGLFVVRRQSWLGFNSKFVEYGGQQGYIHKKYHRAGRKIMCLSQLKWVHKFFRVQDKTPYPMRMETRFANYVNGWLEVGLNVQEMFAYFKPVVRQDVYDRYYSMWQTLKNLQV